jgi:hypothetical protein
MVWQDSGGRTVFSIRAIWRLKSPVSSYLAQKRAALPRNQGHRNQAEFCRNQPRPKNRLQQQPMPQHMPIAQQASATICGTAAIAALEVNRAASAAVLAINFMANLRQKSG